MNSFRKSPFVCLLVALCQLSSGKLRLPKTKIGEKLVMGNGDEYIIFRQINIPTREKSNNKSAFDVQFKFKRLLHKANKITSIVPMLMIAGFPGFIDKIYSVNPKTGYWQGSYQWQTKEQMEAYKTSFVFRVMNKRAVASTIQFS